MDGAERNLPRREAKRLLGRLEDVSGVVETSRGLGLERRIGEVLRRLRLANAPLRRVQLRQVLKAV